MEQIVIYSCLLLLLFANINLTMLFYLHMFQLNSYQFLSHMRWAKSKWVKDIVFRNIWLFILIAISFSENAVLLITGILIGIFLMLRVNRKREYKKPLKYTKRLTRLLITTGLLNIVAAILVINFLTLPQAVIALTIWTILLPFIILIADFINKPMELAINQSYINRAKKKLADMKRLKIIGITGSYGKTSTKYFLNKLLSVKYNVVMTPGNFNTTLGVVRTILENLNATHEIFLCEMGARHVKDIKKICDVVHPHCGIISSIGPQHLETFFTIENIINTKFELADALAEDGEIFLNYDNDYIKKHKTKKKIVTYGSQAKNLDYKVENCKVTAKGSTFTIRLKNGETQEFKTKLIGKHNVENIAGAIAVAHRFGISLEELNYPVKTLEAVPHRLQLVKGNTATIIDDAYNSNPVGAKAALETLDGFEGLKILITPGMVELGAKENELNYEFGCQAAQICDYIVLVGTTQTQYIKEGIQSKKFSDEKLFVVESFQEGMQRIAEINSEKEKFVLIENDLPDNY